MEIFFILFLSIIGLLILASVYLSIYENINTFDCVEVKVIDFKNNILTFIYKDIGIYELKVNDLDFNIEDCKLNLSFRTKNKQITEIISIFVNNTNFEFIKYELKKIIK